MEMMGRRVMANWFETASSVTEQALISTTLHDTHFLDRHAPHRSLLAPHNTPAE